MVDVGYVALVIIVVGIVGIVVIVVVVVAVDALGCCRYGGCYLSRLVLTLVCVVDALVVVV